MQDTNKQIIIAGIDEVGRGPLAGPVVAAAVIFDPNKPLISGLKDSKKLSAGKREKLFKLICDEALAIAVGRAEASEIDKINILRASLLAMRRAAEKLTIQPKQILVDGSYCPDVNFKCDLKAIIGGDSSEPVISAASIIAKVIRDREMVALDSTYPEYGFAKHKGYGTRQHLLALQRLGPTPIHRRSFSPVRKIL